MTKSNLIPRQILFGNPERTAFRLSPDGKYMSFLAPKEGVLNVWVAPRGRLEEASPVTDDKDRGIRSYFWAYTNNHIVYVQDLKGNENWHLYCVDLETKKSTDLTPGENLQARVQEVSPQFPEEMLIALNERDPAFHDLYRINIRTGKKDILLANKEYAAFVTDRKFDIRLGIQQRQDGGNQIFQYINKEWTLWTEIEPEDSLTCYPVGFNKGGDILYMVDSRGRNTAALLSYDLKNNQSKLLFDNVKAN